MKIKPCRLGYKKCADCNPPKNKPITDKMRLDYIQQQYRWKRMVVLDYLNVGEHGSVRRAIDTAIRAERRAGK